MRESRLFIILISLVMGLAGCSKETMIGEYVDRCAVRLDIDWGPCGIDPDGMTALFYPVDGGEPSRFLTNTVTGDEVRLRKGIYNVVVFNQAAEEYSYLTIEGQDQYSTLRIVMKTTDSDWYTPTEGERLIYDPEPLAVATLEGFEVTQEMVRANLKEGKEFSLACRPEKVIFTTHLSLEIKGFDGKLHQTRQGKYKIKANEAAPIAASSIAGLLQDNSHRETMAVITIRQGKKIVDRQNVYFALPKELLLRQPDIQIQISEEQGKKYLTATTDRLACDVMFYLPGVKAVFTDNYKDLLPGHPFRTEIRTPLSKEEIEQQIRCRWVGK